MIQSPLLKSKRVGHFRTYCNPTATQLQPNWMERVSTRWHNQRQWGLVSIAMLDFWGSHGIGWDSLAQALNLARLPIPPLRRGGMQRKYREHILNTVRLGR
jgi:hypothetical protein